MTTYTGTSADEAITPSRVSSTVSHPIFTTLNGDDLLLGNGGDDTLDGGDANDTLKGGAGDDWLVDVDGNNQLFGGTGDDYLSGGDNVAASRDTLHGGDGNDSLNGTNGDILLGEAGDDQITFFDGTSPSIDGGKQDTEEGDELFLTNVASNTGTVDLTAASISEVETLHSLFDFTVKLSMAQLAGFTRIYNQDTLELALTTSGTATVDLVGTYVVTITGTSGADVLHLEGSSGSAVVEGNGGDDAIFTGAGLDTLDGGEGGDTLDGGGHAATGTTGDSLDGGDGNDVLAVHSLDTVFGGADNDRFEMASGEVPATLTLIDGESGHDTLVFDGGGDLGHAVILEVEELLAGADTLSLSAVQLGGFEEVSSDGTSPDAFLRLTAGGVVGTLDVTGLATLHLTSAASVTSSINVTFHAASARIDMTGGSARDTISGDHGADTLGGAAGDDSLQGLGGADSLHGGADDDTLSGGVDGDTLLGDAGLDSLLGGDGADSLRGGDDGDTLDGAAGLDTLLGEGGDDTLLGGADADSLEGGNGADSADGGTGVDTVDGGAGDDTLAGGIGGDLLKGSGGNDQLAGDDGADTLTGGPGDDTLDGGDGIDTASYATATAGVKVSLAVVGPQVLDGAGTDDLVSIENLTGGAYADSLTGGTGDNLLDGLGGNDTLVGGAGADTFLFEQGSGADIIKGFVNGEDKVSFVGLGFDNAQDIIDLAATQVGRDTVIFIVDAYTDVTQVTLLGFDFSRLDASDFGLVTA